VGGLLHLASVRYYDLVGGSRELVRQLHFRAALRYPTTGLVLGGIRPAAFLGAPYSVLSQRLVIDVKGSWGGALTRGGSLSLTPVAGDIEGHQASAGEHAVWEEIAGVEAISTVKGFQVGASKSRTLLTVTPANASTTLAARCNGSTCSGLDRYAYCEIRNAFGTPSYASSWSCADVAPPSVPAPQEMRISACANFEYYSWKGYVYYARSASASSFSIIPTAQPESCGSGTTAWMPPARESAAGGGIVANLDPYTPLVLRPEYLPSPFTVLDSLIFSQNSGVTNVVTAGDPVSVVTGNNQHVELDLRIAGRAGHDLRLVRSYNSRLDYDGPLGHGWIHSFDQHLVRDVAASRVIWRDEQGNEIRFADGATNLTPETGVHDTLARGADGWYTLTRKNGTVYRFQPENAAGRAHLREIRDRNGNTISCSWSGDRLASVTDTAGRVLAFTHVAGRLTEIQDWTGRRWRYAVDARGDLVEFRDPVQSAADLAVPGSGQPVRYSYWSEHADPRLAHNLKCWIRPAAGAAASGVAQLCGSHPGRQWIHFRYHTNDTVESHTDSLGRTTTFAFNFFRRRSSVTHPDGAIESYIFDAKGNVVRHETARGAVRRFEYAPGTRDKTREWDAFGNLTVAAYDGRGNVTSRTDRLGRQESWSWNAFSQPTLHVDRRGVRREWEYDAAGNLRFEYRYVDGLRQAVRQGSYGSFGNRALDVAYDGPGFANGSFTSFAYDATGTAVTRVTDPLGYSTYLTVDALGRVTRSERSRSDGGGVETVTVHTRWDANDRIDQVIDPHGTARRSVYDANGRVVQRRTVPPDQIAAPEATAGRADETLVYDAGGNLASRTDAQGNVTSFEVDARDRLAAIVTPLGGRQEHRYDLHGNRVRITDVSGRTLDFEYDLEDRLVRAVDGLGRAVRSELDAEGRVMRRWAPGATSAGRLVYEALERDGEGNPTRERDAAGREYRRTWDEFARLERLEGPIGLAENATTAWTYTFQGWPRTRTDGQGHQIEVVYDRLGQPRTIYDGLDRARQLSYDQLGNRTLEIDATGARMSYRYDARGLLLERSGPGVGDRYAYDDFGRRVTAANGVSAHRFRYDDLDRVVEHEGSLMGTARFAYDADGRLAHVVYPKTPGSSFGSDAAVVTYQYDEAGRVVSIHDSELAGLAGVGVEGGFQFAWDAAGRLAERSDANGATRSVRFTAEGWVDAVDFGARGAASGTIDYRSYDALGNPGVIEYPGGLVTDPSYDARSRVTSATHTGLLLEQFDYDGAGNRTRRWYGGDNRRYDLDAADQLTRTRRIASGGVETQTVLERFSYDAAGRRTLWEELNEATGSVARTTAYGYDGLGRLTSVDFDTSGTSADWAIDLEYGPLGERIRRTETQGGVTKESLYLGGLVELRGIVGGAPQAQVRILAGPGPGGVVAEITNLPATGASGVFSVFGDAAGNAVRALEVGELPGLPFTTTQVQRFRSFGETAPGSGPALIERGFAGRVAEGPSGLVEMGARHYDPLHGRFLQPDPIGLATDQPYAYAANNPFVYGDPLGLSPVRISGDLPLYPLASQTSSWWSESIAESGSVASGASSDSPFVPDAYRASVGGGLGLVANVDASFDPNGNFQSASLSVGFGAGGRIGIAGLAQESLAGLPSGPSPTVTFGTSVSYSPLPAGPIVGFDTRVGPGGFVDASFSGGLSVGAPIFACAPCLSLNVDLDDLLTIVNAVGAMPPPF
jgi:RHS repeat-associated protein